MAIENKFYYYDDVAEIFAEKLSAKVLEKFHNDSFEVRISDLTKQVLRNFVTMLQTINTTVTLLDNDCNTVCRVSSYKFANGVVTITFIDSNWRDVGEIDIDIYSTGRKQVKFTQPKMDAIKPLFTAIVMQQID